MSALMAERIRLIVDTEERLRRAVRIAAARRGISPSDVLNSLIEDHLPNEVAEAEKAIKEEQDPKSRDRKKG